MADKFLFTSESVTEGHPDKIADQISDTILDAILAQDSHGRVACETIVTTGQVHVFGEIRTTAHMDYGALIRKTINDIGYTDARYGFDGESVGINVAIDEQSPDIAMGVNQSLEAKEKKADKKAAGVVTPDQCTIEDFGKLDLRVGTIQKAEKMPNADKLLKIEVKVGDEVRTIVSGIAPYYKEEELTGKNVIVIANLKPAKLRGVESRGIPRFQD